MPLIVPSVGFSAIPVGKDGLTSQEVTVPPLTVGRFGDIGCTLREGQIL